MTQSCWRVTGSRRPARPRGKSIASCNFVVAVPLVHFGFASISPEVQGTRPCCSHAARKYMSTCKMCLVAPACRDYAAATQTQECEITITTLNSTSSGEHKVCLPGDAPKTHRVRMTRSQPWCICTPLLLPQPVCTCHALVCPHTGGAQARYSVFSLRNCPWPSPLLQFSSVEECSLPVLLTKTSVAHDHQSRTICNCNSQQQVVS